MSDTYVQPDNHGPENTENIYMKNFFKIKASKINDSHIGSEEAMNHKFI